MSVFNVLVVMRAAPGLNVVVAAGVFVDGWQTTTNSNSFGSDRCRVQQHK
jgi:hypothetical protein